MLNDPRVSACIVLYHPGDEVMDAIACLKASVEPVAVFVADNSPELPMGKRIQARWPDVTVLPQKGNVGFAKANNAVLPLLNSAYHLICNPDITFEPDLLLRMVRYMDEHKDIAILTPRVFNTDGSEQFLPKHRPTIRFLMGGPLAIRGEKVLKEAGAAAERAAQLDAEARARWDSYHKRARKGFSGLRELMICNRVEWRQSFARWKAERLKRKGERLCRWRQAYTLQDDPPTQPMEVQFATGCFLLIRSQLFYRLRGFDERFFLYQEDSDLTMRATRMGKVVYHPDMCVTHAWKRDSSHSFRQTLLHVQSTVKFFMKWGWRW